MTIDVTNVHSLSDSQRNARHYIRKLKKSGSRPFLQSTAKAEVVVQSAAAYQKLLDDRQRLDDILRISRGLDEAKRRQGRPMRQFLEDLAKEYRISLK